MSLFAGKRTEEHFCAGVADYAPERHVPLEIPGPYDRQFAWKHACVPVKHVMQDMFYPA